MRTLEKERAMIRATWQGQGKLLIDSVEKRSYSQLYYEHYVFLLDRGDTKMRIGRIPYGYDSAVEHLLKQYWTWLAIQRGSNYEEYATKKYRAWINHSRRIRIA